MKDDDKQYICSTVHVEQVAVQGTANGLTDLVWMGWFFSLICTRPRRDKLAYLHFSFDPFSHRASL
jgi:hypothetical protein